MRLEQVSPCPFCGEKPAKHDSVGPTGFTWSTEEEQIFSVACMTKDCLPNGVYMPDAVWNREAATKETLMDEVFSILKAEKSPLLNDKHEAYRAYINK